MFAPLTTGDYLRRQKLRADRLMKKQDLLDEIVKAQGFESDDIAAMPREIHEEIDYIESQYPGGNLLTAIFVGAEVVTELWKAAKTKD